MTSSRRPGALRPGRARARSAVGYGVLIAVVVAAAGFTFWYRAAYHVLPGQDAAGQVHWCGRDYQVSGGSVVSWRQLSAQPPPLRAVGRYPPLGWPGQEMFAAAASPPPRPSASPPLPCAVVVYLRTGPGQYRPYSLEGGP